MPVSHQVFNLSLGLTGKRERELEYQDTYYFRWILPSLWNTDGISRFSKQGCNSPRHTWRLSVSTGIWIPGPRFFPFRPHIHSHVRTWVRACCQLFVDLRPLGTSLVPVKVVPSVTPDFSTRLKLGWLGVPGLFCSNSNCRDSWPSWEIVLCSPGNCGFSPSLSLRATVAKAIEESEVPATLFPTERRCLFELKTVKSCLHFHHTSSLFESLFVLSDPTTRHPYWQLR